MALQLQYIEPINNSELWNVRHVFIFYKLLFNLILQITLTDQWLMNAALST
jgi:hypothetical protein